METKIEGGLSAREVFQLLYEMFKKEGNEIELEEVLVEIANDSDGHREKIGYSSYNAVSVLDTGKKRWGVCIGTATGDYPANAFNCDIVVLPILKEDPIDIAEEVSKFLLGCPYFRNSPLVAFADGGIAINTKNVFGNNMVAKLGNSMDEFIAKDAVINDELFTMDTRPLVVSSVLYKKELAKFFYDNIKKMFI